jgi:Peptidase family S41/Tricorn protease C1 domain
MKKILINTAIIFSAILFFASCSKVLITPNKKATPTICFNELWQTINDKYTFFDYKKVNWDSIKTVYAPQVNDNMSEQALFDVLAKVIGSLRDGHTSIYAPIDTFRYLFYKGYPANYDSNFVLNKYLTPNGFKTSETIKHCIINGNIGYMHYPSFSNDLTQKSLDELFTGFANTKGLIIDVRNNTGGDNQNILKLLSHFVTTQTKLGTEIIKKDAGKNSFTAPYDITIAPQGVPYNKPIVVLTNRLVFSSANIFSGFISQLPNVKLIGDITGGGTGVPTSNDLPNGWRYRYSSTIIRLANGTDFEDGLLPTIPLATDSATQVATGKDALIERGILELQ